MTTQNDWLTNYFGDDVADDLEKTAQAHLLVKLAEQAGLDINQLSEEELQALAMELMQELDAQGGQPGAPGQQLPGQMPGMQPQMGAPQANPLAQFGQPTQQRPAQGLQQQAQPQQGHPGMGTPGGGAGGLSPEMAKEAQAKFEEADALGRVMAHAYVEELDKIASAREAEKTAGRFGDAAKAVGSRAKSMAQSASWKAKGHAENIGHQARTRAREVGDHIGRNKGAYGAGAGGIAAGVAAGRMSKKEKTASAFEKLATDRAVEILQTLGIDPQTGEQIQDAGQVQQDVGVQGQDPQFDTAIDQRALQLLGEAGYDPSAVAQAYDQTVGQAGQ